MARIEIHAEVVAGLSAQAQGRLHVVNHETGMRLERHFHAAIASKPCGVSPVRQRLALPLPLQHLEKLGRPRRGHPVGMRRRLGIAGASGKCHDDRHVQPLRQAHGLAKQLVIGRREILARMQRIAVTRQGANREAGVGNHPPVVARLRRVVHQIIELEMIGPGPGARAKLDRLNFSERLHLREHLFSAELSKNRREDSKFHQLLTVGASIQRECVERVVDGHQHVLVAVEQIGFRRV